MSRIEGITPHKKHKTVTERRGKFSHHDDLKKKSLNHKQKIAVVAFISFIVVFSVWMILMRNGYLYVSTSSDQEFVTNISESFKDGDTVKTITLPDVTTDDTSSTEEDPSETSEKLFPQFSQ